VLPRSARLAAWGTAVLTGAAAPDQAIRAVTGDDEPHRVELSEDLAPGISVPGECGLRELFGVLAGADATGLRLVLPAPGDVLGLPGPPAFNVVALEAGECLLVECADPDAVPLALVPEVVEFGSVWEPGAMVTWRLYATNARRITDVGSVADADRELRTALATATQELSRLDVARWREDAADRVAAIRDGGLSRASLPPGTPPRCVHVLSIAARVRAIIALAGEDDGAAVTGHEALRRAEALRGLDAVSRRAVTAAVNGLLEPHR